MLAFERFKGWGGPAGLQRGTVFGDGSCYHRGLYQVLVDIGRADAGLNGVTIVRNRLAQYLEDHATDQMPGDTQTFMDAAMSVAHHDWEKPPAHFEELLRRARALEWVDSFFVQAPQYE